MSYETEREVLIASLKGEFSGHEIIDVQIGCRKGGELTFVVVPAVQLSEEWALHKELDSIGWVCTYIPNGYTIGTYPTLAQACMALGAVIALDLPIHLITSPEVGAQLLRDLPKEGKTLRKAFKAIKEMEPTDVEY